MDTELTDKIIISNARRRYLVRGVVIAMISLVMALLAGFITSALTDKTPVEPKLSAPPLLFSAKDKEPTPLVSRDTVDEALPTRAFARLEGGTATFEHYRGKPLVINFFATTCPPCIKEMPDFEAIHQELGDNVNFVGVSLRESAEDAQGLVKRTKVTYDIIRDPSGNLANALGVINMPSTFFVSPDGKIIDSVPGAINADELRAKIKKLTK